MDLFGSFLGEEVNFIDFYFSVGFLSYKVDFVEVIVVLALDFRGPGWVLLGVDEDESAFFEVVHFYM